MNCSSGSEEKKRCLPVCHPGRERTKCKAPSRQNSWHFSRHCAAKHRCWWSVCLQDKAKHDTEWSSSSSDQHFHALPGFSFCQLSSSPSIDERCYSFCLQCCVAPDDDLRLNLPKGKSSRQQMAGPTVIQDQQDCKALKLPALST